jgi:hypothetical protein
VFVQVGRGRALINHHLRLFNVDTVGDNVETFPTLARFTSLSYGQDSYTTNVPGTLC